MIARYFKRAVFSAIVLSIAIMPLAIRAAESGAANTAQNTARPLGYLEKWVGKSPVSLSLEDAKLYPGLVELPEHQTLYADRNVKAIIKKTFDKEIASLIVNGWDSPRGNMDFQIQKQGDILWWYKCKVGYCGYDSAYIFINMRTTDMHACFVIDSKSYWVSAKGRRELPKYSCLNNIGMEAYAQFADR